MRTVLRTILLCPCLMFAIAPVLVRAQEKPVSPDAIAKSPEIALFEESPERRLLITGFGVANYTYDFNTDHNSFGDSALAIAFSKVISNHFTVFAQLTTSREEPSPFLSDNSTP